MFEVEARILELIPNCRITVRKRGIDQDKGDRAGMMLSKEVASLKTSSCLILWRALYSCFHCEVSRLGFQKHQSVTVWGRGMA